MKLFENKSHIFILYLLIISACYGQAAFFGKSLIPTSYYPKPLSASQRYEGREPVNSFNVDLATPAFYEMPINKAIGNMYKKGQLPLWNPYQAAGTPFAAQYSTRAFFPYQILEDISPVWLWDYFMLLRLVIAAFFTYLFLRLLGVSKEASFLGGVLYSLSGSFTWFINLEQFVNVAMMVPICFFSLERLIKFKGRRHIAEAAIVLALMLLAGQPEIAIYVVLLLVSYYVFRVVIERPESLIFLKKILKLSFIILLSLGLASILILPFLELVSHSYHTHPLGGTMGVQDPARLHIAAGMFIPSFFETPTFLRVFPHDGVWDCLGGYIGSLVLFLVILGFFYNSKLKKYFLFFSLFGIAIVFKNFGAPIISLIGKLPLLNQSWSPRWAGSTWTFSLSCAAAIALQMIYNQPARKRRVYFFAAGCALAVVLFSIYKSTYIPQLFNLSSGQVKAVLPQIAGGVLVSLLIIASAVYLLLKSKDKKSIVYGYILLSLFELMFYIPKGMGFPYTAYKFIPFILGVIAVVLLTKRKWSLALAGIILAVVLSTCINVLSPYGFPERHDIFKKPNYVKFLEEKKDYGRIVADGGMLMPNFASAYSLYDIRYINSLSPLLYQNYVDNHLLKEPHAWITDRLWFTGIADLHKKKRRSIYQEINENLLYYSYLGVKYIIGNRSLQSNFPLAYNKEVKIYENPYAFERAYLAKNIREALDFEDAQNMMRNKSINIRQTAIIEKGPPAYFKAPKDKTDGTVKITRYKPSEVEIKAKLKTDGIVVLTDVFYPGWSAYVDGQQTEIYRVNGLVRGVFIREGRHNIIFKYNPLSFNTGLVVSGLSLLVCLGLIAGDRIKENES